MMNHCHYTCKYSVEVVYKHIARCFTSISVWSGIYMDGGCLHFLTDPAMWEGLILEVDTLYASGILTTQDMCVAQEGHAWSCNA